MNHPCKDCPRCGCGAYHDECANYKGWKAEREKAATRRRLDADVTECVIKGKIRAKGDKRR